MRTLIAIPVYNEERYVERVLTRVLARPEVTDVLAIDDGSSDATPSLLARFPVDVIRHSVNRGYGRSMQDAFSWAALRGFDWVITMDCDEQHEPDSIPAFLDRIRAGKADVVSGSRYMNLAVGVGTPPADRRAINQQITEELNRRLGSRLGVRLTDAFCGFKAYRVSRVGELPLTEDGYAFPMQFWVQCAAMGLRVEELPVRLIYNDPTRTFGGPLNDPGTRLRHYREVLEHEMQRWAARLGNAAVHPCCCGASRCESA